MRLPAILVVCLLLSAPLLGQAEDNPPNPCPGRGSFSCDAIDISDFTGMAGMNATKQKPFTLSSPDKKKRIEVCCHYDKDKTPEISVAVGAKSFPTAIGYLTDAEIAWSPDSLAFAETHTNGGAVGDFEVTIYHVFTSGLRYTVPTKYVEKNFMTWPVRCAGPREGPNLAFVKWGEDSRTVYLAAEILPHSICDEMGTFKLYKVALPSGKILRIWDQLQAKKEFWNSLGQELRGAEDDCIRDPFSCYVPYNHPECFPKNKTGRTPAYCKEVIETANSSD